MHYAASSERIDVCQASASGFTVSMKLDVRNGAAQLDINSKIQLPCPEVGRDLGLLLGGLSCTLIFVKP